MPSNAGKMVLETFILAWKDYIQVGFYQQGPARTLGQSDLETYFNNLTLEFIIPIRQTKAITV